MNEIHAILNDSLSHLFEGLVSPSLLDAAEKGSWPDALWQAIEAQGFASALLPESAGGYGNSWHDFFFIVSACGRFSLPAPLPETLIARWLLNQSGLEIPSGALTIACPQSELQLTKTEGRWRLRGELQRVPFGRAASAVVLLLDIAGTLMVISVPTTGVEIRLGANLAREWRDTFIFAGDRVEAAPWPAGRWQPDVAVLGSLLRSAQIAGGLRAILELSVTYANDRRQFGKPIGKFQAIQQNLAVLAAETAAANVAAENAFCAADHHDPAFLVACAKVRVAEATRKASAVAHQVHGAIGFTREYPLHWATRRLAAWRAEFGSEHDWATRLGRQVVQCGTDGFWPQLSAE
jgi:alkylation response protein AidB-like acyl-CoA dehydrogenase